MTPQEQIEIIQAYERGEEIEYKYKCDRDGNNSWIKVPALNKNHQFNFYDYDYRIKGKIWRAQKDEEYYFINSFMEACSCFDTYGDTDNNRFNAGNYFENADKAIRAKKMLRGVLTKFHTENE